MISRRYVNVRLLVVVGLLAGFLYLQTKRPLIFSNKVGNEIALWNLSTADGVIFSNPHAQNSTVLRNVKTQIGSKTKTAKKEIFPHPYQYIVENADLCTGGSTEKGKFSIIILVCSALNNFANRQGIRETWGSVALSNNNTDSVKLSFLLGSSENTTLQKLVMKESLQHSDIIQENFCDTYQNLTLKSVMLLKWVSEHCSNVHFVLKTDDDMYINVAKLIYTLKRLPLKSKVMYGALFREARPLLNKSSKWYAPKEQFQGDVYPDYLSGTAYVMSRDIISTLYEISTTLPFLVMEDVFITGLCASQVGVQRYNVEGFAYWRRSPEGCAFRDAISGHHVTITEMKKIWTELQEPKLMCRMTRKSS